MTSSQPNKNDFEIALEYALSQTAGARRAMDSTKALEIPNDAIPGYQLLELLGRGGQGSVYKAVQVATKKLVAIKVIHPHLVSGHDARTRLEREVRVLAHLDHRNIVRILDGGVAGSRHYLVMEFVDGSRFLGFLSRSVRSSGQEVHEVSEPPYPVDQLVSQIATVCDAVHAAHLRGVIHRDLKPSNILIDKSGEPHVLDFGLAKIVGADGITVTQTAITAPGAVVGTLPWLSPEQLRSGDDEVDIRTDVYALGLLLLVGLTGAVPFDATKPIADLIEQICYSDHTHESSFPKHVKSDLRKITIRAIHKDRQRRYQSAVELKADLESYLRGDAVSICLDSWWYRARKAVKRHVVIASMVSLLTVFAIVYGVSVTVLYERAQLAEKEQAKAASDARTLLESTLKAFRASVIETKKLVNLPGGDRAREALLQSYIDSLGPLSEKPLVDKRLRAELAQALSGLADWAYDTQQIEKCRTLRRSSLRIFGELVREDPTQPDWQRAYATELVRAESGSVGDGVLSHETTAHEIFTSLVRAHPENLDYLDDLSWSHERLGMRGIKSEDYGTAQKHFELRHSLSEKLCRLDPGNALRLQGLRTSHALLSLLHSRTHDPALSLFHASIAGDILQKLYDSDQNRTDFASDLAGWHIARSVYLSDCLDQDGALFHADKASEIVEKLMREGDLNLRSSLIKQRLSFAYATCFMVDKKDAFEFDKHAEDSIAIAMSICLQDPEHLDFVWGLTRCHIYCAISSTRVGDLPRAHNHVTEVKFLSNRLLTAPDVTADMLNSIASDVYLRQEVQELYSPIVALDLAERANQKLPNVARFLKTIAIAMHALGEDESALQDVDIAIAQVTYEGPETYRTELEELRSKILEALRTRREVVDGAN